MIPVVEQNQLDIDFLNGLGDRAVEKAQRLDQEYESLGKQTVEIIVRYGAILSEMKTLLGHGNYTKWLRFKGLSEDTALRYVHAASKLGDRLEEHPAICGLLKSVVYELTSPSVDEAAIDEAIELAEAGQELSVADGRAIARKHQASEQGHTFEQVRELYNALALEGEPGFAATGLRKWSYSFGVVGKSWTFKSLDDAVRGYDAIAHWVDQRRTPQAEESCQRCKHQLMADADTWSCEAKGDGIVFGKGEDVAGEGDGCRLFKNRYPDHSGTVPFNGAMPATALRREDGIAKSAETVSHPAGVLASSGNNERYTPEWLWRPGLDCFGVEEFDLDPSTYADSPIPTKNYYTVEDDGLEQDWTAENMWSNFPYSEIQTWCERLVYEFEVGRLKRALTLVKCDCRTKWFKTLCDNATAFALIHKNIQFGGTDHSSFFGGVIFYFGDNPSAFAKAYSHLGTVAQSIPLEVES